MKERIDKGIGVVEEGAPQVMIYLAHFSDPRIGHMIEGCGLSIPQTYLAAIMSKYRRSTPLVSGEILAREELARGSFHGNCGVVTRVAEIIRETKVDGIIWNYLYNCRPISQPVYLLKHFVERETGVPVLALESDLADSRTYSAETLRTRVETFAEMLRLRKAAVKG